MSTQTTDDNERPSWQRLVDVEEDFILDALRKPLAKLSGSLSSVPVPTLRAIAIKGVLERAGLSLVQIARALPGNVLRPGVRQALVKRASRGENHGVTSDQHRTFALQSRLRAAANGMVR